MKALLIAIALTALPAFAEDKPLIDKTDDKLASGRKSAKSSAEKAEDDTDRALAKARKKSKSSAQKAEDSANEAAHKLRRALGTEK